jgi:hypothetical protein
MNKININEEFALKVRTGRFEGKVQRVIFYNDFKKKLKEIIDNIIDKCADEVKSKSTTILNGAGDEFEIFNHINKSSIFRVKEMINYE